MARRGVGAMRLCAGRHSRCSPVTQVGGAPCGGRASPFFFSFFFFFAFLAGVCLFVGPLAARNGASKQGSAGTTNEGCFAFYVLSTVPLQHPITEQFHTLQVDPPAGDTPYLGTPSVESDNRTAHMTDKIDGMPRLHIFARLWSGTDEKDGDSFYFSRANNDFAPSTVSSSEKGCGGMRVGWTRLWRSRTP